MDLEHLRYFKVVAETQHITRSAELLHISQPSLSKVISNVEDFVGTRLFSREKSKIYLNEDGRLFLERLTRFFSTLDQAKEEILQDFALETGLLRVSSSVSSGILIDYFSSLYRRFPGIRMIQNVESEPSIQQKLLLGSIDLGITSMPLSESSPQVRSTLLLRDKMMALVPLDHPLAEQEHLSIQDLKGERIVTGNSGISLRGQIAKVIQETGVELNIVVESSSPDMIGVILSEGECLGLIPASAHYRMHLSAGPRQAPLYHRVLPIEGDFFTRDFYLNYLDGQQISEIATLVKQELPAWFRDFSVSTTA